MLRRGDFVSLLGKYSRRAKRKGFVRPRYHTGPGYRSEEIWVIDYGLRRLLGGGKRRRM